MGLIIGARSSPSNRVSSQLLGSGGAAPSFFLAQTQLAVEDGASRCVATSSADGFAPASLWVGASRNGCSGDDASK